MERQAPTRRGQSRFHRMKTGTVPSLRELAKEIAAVAGSDPRRTADRIAAAYSATETRLHRRLDGLLAKIGTFTLLDRRAATSSPLAVPDRTGAMPTLAWACSSHGTSCPRKRGHGTRYTKMKDTLVVPDRFLAAAIDGLARCIGPAGCLVAVDFRAMDVRELGVVHECLSHCKLGLSSQGRPTPCRRQGGAETRRLLLHPRTDRAADRRRGRRAGNRTQAPGGSTAMGRRRPARRRRDARRTPRFPRPRPGGRQRYFLLAAADFPAKRLDDFLRRLPRGKRAGVALASRRRVALASRQCSAQALARRQCHPEEADIPSLPLLKREVVQRCLYGVDLDPVAVELAKASLLLDAGMSPATGRRVALASRQCSARALARRQCHPAASGLPAPLDAHFRCGNSLLGETLAELGGGAGFDVVIGNPPYRGVRTGTFGRAFAEYVASHYAAARGNWDLASLFLEKSLAVGKPQSACGFIVPSRIAANRDFTALRQAHLRRRRSGRGDRVRSGLRRSGRAGFHRDDHPPARVGKRAVGALERWEREVMDHNAIDAAIAPRSAAVQRSAAGPRGVVSADRPGRPVAWESWPRSPAAWNAGRTIRTSRVGHGRGFCPSSAGRRCASSASSRKGCSSRRA